MHRIELNDAKRTVMLRAAPVKIDLGGIAKGYAADQMAALLRDWDIHAALIHGGRSSILALDSPPGARGWPVRLRNPANRNQPLTELCLKNQALGGSGVKKGDHIIDPRSGQPVQDKLGAWCRAPTAAIADALSTAFMVMTPQEIAQYCSRHPNVAAMIVTRRAATSGSATVRRYGTWKHDGLRPPLKNGPTDPQPP
jgi:thiamine biosynthesis lipoprotein